MPKRPELLLATGSQELVEVDLLGPLPKDLKRKSVCTSNCRLLFQDSSRGTYLQDDCGAYLISSYGKVYHSIWYSTVRIDGNEVAVCQ